MANNIDNVIYNALLPVIDAFEQLEIPYYLSGSIASSMYGVSRPTQNVDVVADIQIKHVISLVKRLEAEYYIDADMIQDAIHHQSSFNLIYLASMFKVDVFLPKPRPFTQQERLRARKEVIEEGTRSFYLSSPEDIILNKLEWYKMGNEISNRQWNDIIGVMRRQSKTLDLAYLQHWAVELSVLELLERAFAETSINGN
jgi:hypothetical protein